MTIQSLDHDEIIRRISRDLADGYDEELEIEDRHPLLSPLPRRRSAADGIRISPTSFER
jgi:hypothetical protein